jgi:hypothetical protein
VDAMCKVSCAKNHISTKNNNTATFYALAYFSMYYCSCALAGFDLTIQELQSANAETLPLDHAVRQKKIVATCM